MQFSELKTWNMKNNKNLQNLSFKCFRNFFTELTTEEDFEKLVLKSKKPVVVDFYGTW